MANMMKWTRMQAMAIIAHQERTGATHSNENIDPERTKDNYAVWPYEDPDRVGEKHGWRRLLQRLEKVKYLQRKDVNVLVEWTIHLGVDCPPGYESQKAFFESCMRYCEKLYGSENICYGIVHLDEETPHLTVGFVPVVRKPLKLRKNASAATRAAYEAALKEGKTEIETVDADSVITRKHLQDWHGGLTAHLIAELGYDPAVLTGITKAMGGNMPVKRLKSQSKDWREKRNKRAEQFHEVRRAAKSGKHSSLEARMAMADPKQVRPQADPGPKQRPADGRKPSLDDLMGGARKRGGRDGW